MPGTLLTVKPKATETDPVEGEHLEIKDLRLPAGLQTKVLGEGEGVVQAIVAVTGNVDDGGDIIEPNAFVFDRHPKVVWSHDLNRLIAKVLKFEEWPAGDPRLPADLLNRKLGALVFEMAFDLSDPESHSAYRKVLFHEDLGWSVGYQTPSDGFYNDKEGRRHLTKMVVWEASPASFGMNREARTMATKSALSEAVKALHLPEAKSTALTGLLTTMLEPDDEEKAVLADSFEDAQERVRGALMAWGIETYGKRDQDNDWYPMVEGTFDDAVVVTFRFWSGENEDAVLRFPYTLDDDGAVLLGEPEEVEMQVVVTGASTEGEGSGGEGASGSEPPGEVKGEGGPPEGEEEKSIEDLVADVKAGRVLSASNARRLKEAAEAISAVLAAAEKEAEKEKGSGKTTVVVKPKGEGGGEGETKKLTEAELLEMVALANS